jgi:hypothetical protein
MPRAKINEPFMSIESVGEGSSRVAISMLWTSGSELYLITFPDKKVEVNTAETIMKDQKTLKWHFQVKTDAAEEPKVSPLLGNEKKLKGVVLSQFHYFILFDKHIYIMSRTTEQLVSDLDV